MEAPHRARDVAIKAQKPKSPKAQKPKSPKAQKPKSPKAFQHISSPHHRTNAQLNGLQWTNLDTKKAPKPET